MTDPFSLEARYYDRIWGSDHARYEAEARFLHRIFRQYRVVRVLDLGCGTGEHYLRLARLDYDVVGLDVSEAILEEARKKLIELSMRSALYLGI